MDPDRDAAAQLRGVRADTGNGYLLEFTLPGGHEYATYAAVVAGTAQIAPANLPTGWEPGSSRYRQLERLVLALAAACAAPSSPSSLSSSPSLSQSLRDVEGGWDVALGNVVLDANGNAQCTAHGLLAARDGILVCDQCGAQALQE